MNIGTKGAVFALLMIAALLRTIDPALAHSFNVALVVPSSPSAESRQILEGFMLATTERDSHPDQESDGHLGGLDVYVTVIEAAGTLSADIVAMVNRGEIDVLAAFGSEAALSLIIELLEGQEIALLLPGRSPFDRSELPEVEAFSVAYERAYGHRPSSMAAEGYNAARRIDAAVRDQGGVEDRDSLRRVFQETEQGFNW